MREVVSAAQYDGDIDLTLHKLESPDDSVNVWLPDGRVIEICTDGVIYVYASVDRRKEGEPLEYEYQTFGKALKVTS